MKRKRLPIFCLALVAATLGADEKREPAPVGIVVETVGPGYEAAKAGLQPGDILVSWERAANPPANPAPARGSFRSPFDALEVYIEQAPRAKAVTLFVLREGASVAIPVRQYMPEKTYPWGLGTRPRFSSKRLQRYEEGKRLFTGGEVETGADVWRALAGELSTTGDHVEAAWLWSRLGMERSTAKQSEPALAAIDQALIEARAAGRPDIEAQLWIRKAAVSYEANLDGVGTAAARRALSIRERVTPENLAVRHSLQSLSMYPENPEYEPRGRRSLSIAEKNAPGSLCEAESLSSLSAFMGQTGDSRGAIDYDLRALAIDRALNPVSTRVGWDLSNLCAEEGSRGEFAAAEAYCRQSLIVQRSLEPEGRRGVAISLHNMAWIAGLRGDFGGATELYLQALAIRERVEPVSQGMAINLHELGEIEMRRGNLQNAEGYFRRAEEIQNVVGGPYSPHPAETAARFAEIAYLRGDRASSERLLREAVAYYEKSNPDGPRGARVLDELGRVLAQRGQTDEAEIRLRRALALRQRFAPGSRDTAESKHSLGMLLWKVGRLSEAEGALRGAIDDLESQRSKLGGSEEAWSVFAAGFTDYYKDLASLLMELHREDDAFLILERFRAGAFLRTLAQRDLAAPVEIAGDLDRELRLTNAEYDRTQGALRALNPRDDEKKIDENLARLADLRQKRSEIEERIKKASPRYAALQYPHPLDLSATRTALDPGTILLSYSVGEEESFLFAVSGDSKRGPLLSTFRLPVGDIALRGSIEAFRRLINRNKPSPELLARSRSLYETLLGPAEALIGKHDRLLILADGPLHTLPWAALVRSVKSDRPQYLVEWKPIHTAVSATVYAELKKARRERPGSPAIQVVAFGDPKYPALAARTTAVKRGDGTDEVEEDVYGNAELDAVVRGGYRFQPLPRSRQEVETIAGLYAPKSEAFLGEQATEERARSIGKDVRLIHYACHAYVNERFPLDSALVFTIPDKPKEGQDNGLLQAWEIFEKVHIDADLVTLSACDSGLGKEMGGEGLIGLTRAFHYAGARSVLASLWKVEDESTAELMKRFYGYLKAGKTKDEALRLAQIDLIRSPNYSQPRAWAAFELIGDWK